MQQGKHTEYEKALHEEMLAGLALSPPSPIEGGSEGGERRGVVEEEGGVEWRQSPGEYPPVGSDQWGGTGGGGRGSAGGAGVSSNGEGGDWGGRGGSQGAGDQTWPDLGGGAPLQGYSAKGRFISSNSKDDDKSSKSKRWSPPVCPCHDASLL